MADYESRHHDTHDENGYKKRCYCEKCKRTYDEWCKKNKEEGCTHCKRKCYTVCEIICEKPVTTVHHWGYRKEYEGKWESYRGEERPNKCKSCKKGKKDCKCNEDISVDIHIRDDRDQKPRKRNNKRNY